MFGNIFEGITSDTKQYDQVEINGRLDRLEEQNSVKQSLISSYKKNLYPPLKEEVSRTFPQDETVTGSRANSLTSKSQAQLSALSLKSLTLNSNSI